jgi:hypothetical protein
MIFHMCKSREMVWLIVRFLVVPVIFISTFGPLFLANLIRIKSKPNEFSQKISIMALPDPLAGRMICSQKIFDPNLTH